MCSFLQQGFSTSSGYTQLILNIIHSLSANAIIPVMLVSQLLGCCAQEQLPRHVVSVVTHIYRPEVVCTVEQPVGRKNWFP